MSEHKAEFHPEWVPDCQGKQDYDCEVVALSCRYYPRHGDFSDLTGEDPEVSSSAVASICIGDLANGPYETLATDYFIGATESEVKAKVEAWAREQMARVVAAMRAEFTKPAP